MRRLSIRTGKSKGQVLTKIGGSSAGKWATIVAVLMGIPLLGAAGRAYNQATLNAVSVAKRSTPLPLVQGSGPTHGILHSRLSLQPKADRLRRRLGQRFVTAGKERTIATGVVTIGTNSVPVQIVRTQSDDGERVEIGLGNGSPSLTWNAVEGAKSGATRADGVERQLVERLALYGPDQFILAQVRGASYYTVAREARPVEVGISAEYSGPVWDMIRVAEPEVQSAYRPQSLWRLYYINCQTRLIDTIVSEENGETITAQVSNWTEVGGEIAPRHIVWSRQKQAIMELILGPIGYGGKQ